MSIDRIAINHVDPEQLKVRGVPTQVIDKLRQAKAQGVKFQSKRDLVSSGLSESDAETVLEYVTFVERASRAPVTISVPVKPVRVPGYRLEVTRVLREEISQPLVMDIPDSGTVVYLVESLSNVKSVLVGIRAITGELVESVFKGKTEFTHSCTESELSQLGIEFKPLVFSSKPKGKERLPDTLKGRVLSADTKRNLEGLKILIQVSENTDPVDTDFVTVGMSTTEHGGYFFCGELFNEALESVATIQVARALVFTDVIVSLPLRLVKQKDGKQKLPSKVVLILPDERDGSEDCNCETGGCKTLDFHQRRVLDEFSYYTVVRITEPLIESLSLTDPEEIELADLFAESETVVLKKIQGKRIGRRELKDFLNRHGALTSRNVNTLLHEAQTYSIKATLAGKRSPGGRRLLDGSAAIDWDEEPTIYQATTIAHGHLLHFKQQWFHDGYAIGDLLYSLPLAPGQKKQVVVFDWDRRETASLTQETTVSEALASTLSRDRDINEVANGTLRERSRGVSEANTWGAGGGAGLAAVIPADVPMGLLMGVAGGFGRGSSVAQQTSERDVTASSMQAITDRTIQSANAVRSQRATVIQAVGQGETFEQTAEVVANYNHCHAMTIQYFQVMRHFEIQNRFIEARECLFVPLQISAFTIEKALRWRDILTRCLKKRFLISSFDSLFRVSKEIESPVTNYYDSIGFPKGSFAEEAITDLSGELVVEFRFQRPANKVDDEFDPGNWLHYQPFLGSPKEFYDRHLLITTSRDQVFANQVGPILANEILKHLQVSVELAGSPGLDRVIPVDATLVSPFRHRTGLRVSLRLSDALQGIVRQDVRAVTFSLDSSGSRAAAIKALFTSLSCQAIIRSGRLYYRTSHLNEPLFWSTQIENDLSFDVDSARIYCPLSEEALRRPRQEDADKGNLLLQHLNENLEYYHQCIWSQMDPQRRYLLLDGVLAPGNSEGRSVAGVVENRLIGIVGNCLVLPVAPGFRLNPLAANDDDLFERYHREPADSIHFSLPTKGVFAEAVLGSCNSCELKDEQRFWRWEESPIPDSPTTFNQLTVPTPGRAEPVTEVAALPNPIVNVQTAPAFPDPKGLAEAFALLGKTGLFGDITGLAGNQKNASAALSSAFETSQAFGEGAKQLAGQAVELFKFNKLSEMLGKGQISKEDFRDMILQAPESEELKNLKDIQKAKDKQEIEPETAERLNEAELKKAEQRTDNSSLFNSPGTNAVVEGFSSVQEGKFQAVDGQTSLLIEKKGPPVGRSGAGEFEVIEVPGVSTPELFFERQLKKSGSGDQDLEFIVVASNSGPTVQVMVTFTIKAESGRTGGETEERKVSVLTTIEQGASRVQVAMEKFKKSKDRILTYSTKTIRGSVEKQVDRQVLIDRAEFKLEARVVDRSADRLFELVATSKSDFDIFLTFDCKVLDVASIPSTVPRTVAGVIPARCQNIILESVVFAGMAGSNDTPGLIGNMSFKFGKGDPDATIRATQFFELPFAVGEKYIVGQPPSDGSGSDDNPTHNATNGDGVNTFAVDITMDMGKAVIASRDGVVVEIVENRADLTVNSSGVSVPSASDLENFVTLRHFDGTLSSYLHLKKNSVPVSVGDVVLGGLTQIASSGNSGQSTGPHLHFVVLKLERATFKFKSIPFKFKSKTGGGFTPGEGDELER